MSRQLARVCMSIARNQNHTYAPTGIEASGVDNIGDFDWVVRLSVPSLELRGGNPRSVPDWFYLSMSAFCIVTLMKALLGFDL